MFPHTQMHDAVLIFLSDLLFQTVSLMASIGAPGTTEILDCMKLREGNLIIPLLMTEFLFFFFFTLYNFENCFFIDSFAMTTNLTKDYLCVNFSINDIPSPCVLDL